MLLVINDKCPTKPVNNLAQVLGSTNLYYQCILHINRILILIRKRTMYNTSYGINLRYRRKLWDWKIFFHFIFIWVSKSPKVSNWISLNTRDLSNNNTTKGNINNVRKWNMAEYEKYNTFQRQKFVCVQFRMKKERTSHIHLSLWFLLSSLKKKTWTCKLLFNFLLR